MRSFVVYQWTNVVFFKKRDNMNNKKIRNLEKVLPRYGMVVLLALVIFNAVTYFGTRFVTTNMVHHSMKLAIDDRIPFCSFFVVFYILAYVQWIIGYIIIARESKEHCYRYLFGELVAKLICLVVFILFPTTILRPEITGHGLWESLVRFIYEIDAPDNLFPSIHCLESWVCFRGAIHLKKMPKWYAGLMFVSTVLVFASTVLIKQHVFIDMVGAVVAVEIGLLVSKWLIGKAKIHG